MNENETKTEQAENRRTAEPQKNNKQTVGCIMCTWKRYKDFKNGGWGVYLHNGVLVCVCLYRRGAVALCDFLNRMNSYVAEITNNERKIEDVA